MKYTMILGLVSMLCVSCIASSQAATSRPAPMYLALGDSLAYGMQIGHLKQEIAAGHVTASSFNTGYVNLIAEKLESTNPGLRVVDLGCPAETSSSFINGPCGFATTGKPFGHTPLPMHVQYSGAQLTEALSYLRNKNDDVKLITLDLGINDLRAIELKCTVASTFEKCLQSGWPAVSKTVESNLHTVLSELRSAAPHTKILVMTYYNWLAIAHPRSNQQVKELNGIITKEAHAFNAGTVHLFSAFNAAADGNATLCKLSLICGPTKDLHPTNAGYELIAHLFEQQL
ncbi:MAG: SGNH/GDSL hydrolase family protein [Vulcanimicrobiaceae bacterium]